MKQGGKVEEFRARCRGERDYPPLTELPGYTNARGDVVVELIAAADADLISTPRMSRVRSRTALDQYAIYDAIDWLMTVGLAEPALPPAASGFDAATPPSWRLLPPTTPNHFTGERHEESQR